MGSMSEPRTEAGKRLLDWLYLNGGAFRTEDRDHIEAAILAIEAEAAHPESAQAAMQSSPVDLRAALQEALDWFERGPATNPAFIAGRLRAALRAVPAEAEEAKETEMTAEQETAAEVAFSAWVQSYLDEHVGATDTFHDPELSLVHGNIRGFAYWALEHPFVRPADASGGGEGLDVVRLSQAFLRVNTFMDGIAASQAAGEIAAAYADLDPGRLASDD